MFQAADGGNPGPRTSPPQKSCSADGVHWKRQRVGIGPINNQSHQQSDFKVISQFSVLTAVFSSGN